MALSTNLYALTVFLDLQAAYNHANIHKLYETLLIKWTKPYPM